MVNGELVYLREMSVFGQSNEYLPKICHVDAKGYFILFFLTVVICS